VAGSASLGASKASHRSSAPRRCPRRNLATAAGRDRDAASPADERTADRPGLWAWRADGSGLLLRRLGAGQPGGARSKPPVVRYERRPRADPHRNTEPGRSTASAIASPAITSANTEPAGSVTSKLHVPSMTLALATPRSCEPGQHDATGCLRRAWPVWPPRREGSSAHDRHTARPIAPSSSPARCVSRSRHIRTRPYTPRTNGKGRALQSRPACENGLRQSYASSDQRQLSHRTVDRTTTPQPPTLRHRRPHPLGSA